MQLYREMEVGYCRMVTISTDNLLQTMEYRSGVGAHWPFLSDLEGKVRDDLDIAEYTDPIHNPMIPHTIVLEPGLVVFKCPQRLLVLRAADSRRAPPRSARRAAQMPSRLGPERARAQSGVGTRREKSLLSIRQESVESLDRSVVRDRSILRPAPGDDIERRRPEEDSREKL